MNQMAEALSQEMVQILFGLLEKIELIKAEVAQKYPAEKSTFNFPTINMLEFINLLIGNLKKLASCAVDSILKTVFQTVQEDLVFIRSCLDNIVEQQSHQEKLESFWNRVIEVAYDAEFAIDLLMAGDASFSSLKLFNTVAEEIKLVKIEALEIDNQSVLEVPKVCKTLSHAPLLVTASTNNGVVVGFHREAKEVIDKLTRGLMQLDVASIVGMPGLGKTTLARKVYHDTSVTCHFSTIAWCCVSQVYNRRDLLIEILICILPKNSYDYAIMTEDDLAEVLYKRLKGNRYLIVLDDIWDIGPWNALECSFPKDDNRSRILMTSRHYDVALLVKPSSKPYSLRRLTDDESWELLQKKLGDKEDYSPSLKDLGMQIARNCDGLPLTVVLIAGILANDEVGWVEAAKRLSSSIVCGTDDCAKVLELSYRHLPDSLKPCLLYFGAFSEDQEIPKWKLMRLWIAEGFIQNNAQKSLEDMAEDYTMALISRSLIMVSRKNATGGVKTCRIHDLLHEFCVAKAKEENFFQLINGYDELCKFDEPHNLRRLCIKSQQEYFAKSRLLCPRIRSLLYCAESDASMEIPYNLSLFFQLKLLRVLDLEQINIGAIFPSEIAMLIQLRYLAVYGMMKHIPSLIANLSNLETFLLTLRNRCSLPNTFWNMQHLKYVSAMGIDFSFTEEDLESSTGLQNLETFATPELYLGQSLEKVLRKFPNIRELKCFLLESENSTGENKESVVMDCLSRLESLHLNLAKLNVHDVEFCFPLNLKKVTLEEFCINSLSTIGKLPNLEALKLLGGGCYGEEIWEMEDGDFPKLRFLKLFVDISMWIGSDDHFPFLEKLILLGCWCLKELPSCLRYLSTLEVRHCRKSVVSLVKDIEEEQINMGNEELQVLIY